MTERQRAHPQATHPTSPTRRRMATGATQACAARNGMCPPA
eukprot:CAMPEP_0185310118 /NCGR_PEP_ID=MMETSP1363-20130426/23831_1 /TAXON_ID=38817 /ORGANISM="Gephyrocapsa oceanica, Strain RCC1303" /LENGTH=40 /DNA_ID= /DNA_START= /DNA_END= /DNA_ORIENTATION=